MIEFNLRIEANGEDFDSWAFENDLNKMVAHRLKGYWDFKLKNTNADNETNNNKYKKESFNKMELRR